MEVQRGDGPVHVDLASGQAPQWLSLRIALGNHDKFGRVEDRADALSDAPLRHSSNIIVEESRIIPASLIRQPHDTSAGVVKGAWCVEGNVAVRSDPEYLKVDSS